MKLALKIGPALRARRLDVEDIAEKTFLTSEQLEGIENGRYKTYRISTIEALCEAIECDPGDLFVRQN